MFREWPTQGFVRHLERTAHRLRQRLGLSSIAQLDPEELIGTFPKMRLIRLVDFEESCPDAVARLKVEQATWSAMACRFGGDIWLILANPWHATTRRRVSLMEEVSHIILEHKPTKLTPCPHTGMPIRSFNRSLEKEAYGVAGAALVPYNGLAHFVEQGHSRAEIAEHFGVSDALVRMRLAVVGFGAHRAESGDS